MENPKIIAHEHTRPLPIPLKPDPHLAKLLASIQKASGHAILVGGSVRDHLLNIPSFDYDLEVYRLSQDRLEEVLNAEFSTYFVGKSFGVFKVTVTIGDEKKTIDVAMPRTELKTGLGHKNFEVLTDPHLTFESASSRRDFTINAMGIDVENQLLLDPHGGFSDLQNKVLRHVSEAFREDPLRVLRGAQFAARFNLTMDHQTVLLCRSLKAELSTLSAERIFGEMKKLFLAPTPSLGLKILEDTEAIELFPELLALKGCAQDATWHPEGDVWVHSLMVTDEAAILAQNLDSEEEKLIVVAGALCHDLGKPASTVVIDGRIKSPGHEQAGIPPTVSLLTRMAFPKNIIEQVTPLVAEHLKPHQLYSKKEEVTDAAIKRLAMRVDISKLLYVSQADFRGRTTPEALARHDPSAAWLLEKATALMVDKEPVKPILQGRHLLALGEKPGPKFSKVLSEALEAQIDGEFADETAGIEWLKKKLTE
jgi:tRNA nucleotidyltransferase (CCA-adding enzyme)